MPHHHCKLSILQFRLCVRGCAIRATHVKCPFLQIRLCCEIRYGQIEVGPETEILKNNWFNDKRTSAYSSYSRIASKLLLADLQLMAKAPIAVCLRNMTKAVAQ